MISSSERPALQQQSQQSGGRPSAFFPDEENGLQGRNDQHASRISSSFCSPNTWYGRPYHGLLSASGQCWKWFTEFVNGFVIHRLAHCHELPYATNEAMTILGLLITIVSTILAGIQAFGSSVQPKMVLVCILLELLLVLGPFTRVNPNLAIEAKLQKTITSAGFLVIKSLVMMTLEASLYLFLWELPDWFWGLIFGLNIGSIVLGAGIFACEKCQANSPSNNKQQE